MTDEFADQVAGVASLAEGARRRLYQHVVAQPGAVSRDEAASAVGMKRPLAAFHLDKLVEQGLLDVEYRRLSGRSGPGAGRPAKLYRRSERQIDVTIPPRHYDLAAGILAAAIQRSIDNDQDVPVALRAVATERGHALAGEGADQPRDALWQTLRSLGFEPRPQGRDVVLVNCPFDALAQDFTAIVCGMNLALCEGLASALGVEREGLRPQLRPHQDRCCVTFEQHP